MNKSISSCMACGKTGHKHRTGKPPWNAYLCPLNERHKKGWWGKTIQSPDGRCPECGGSGFSYQNGIHFSADGIRGYRCMNPHCGAVKPERNP